MGLFEISYVALSGAIPLFSAYYWNLFLKHQTRLQDLCAGMHARKYSTGRNGAWRSYACNGVFRGVIVRVESRFRVLSWNLFRWKDARELTIQVPVAQKFWLRLLPESLPALLEDEVAVGIPEFDHSHVVHSNQPDAAREFLQSRFLREMLQKLPLYDRLEFYRGWLRLQLRPSALDGFYRSDLESTIDTLAVISADYTQRGLSFKIVAVASAGELCPYCRSKLTAAEKIHHCPTCDTRLHAACYQENGQCTTWGCR